jgi:hypothetical protein
MRYLLLLYGDETAELALSPEERGAILAAHGTFSRSLQERGWLVGGEPLQASSTAAVVHEGGLVTDGPFIETKEQLGGYYVVECPGLEEALQAAREIPPSPGLKVEVRPLAGM